MSEPNVVNAYTGVAAADWDMLYTFRYPRWDLIGRLRSHQRANHVPGNFALTKKSKLPTTCLSGVLAARARIIEWRQSPGIAHSMGILRNPSPSHFLLPEQAAQLTAAMFLEQNRFRSGNIAPTDVQTDVASGLRWLVKSRDHRGVVLMDANHVLHQSAGNLLTRTSRTNEDSLSAPLPSDARASPRSPSWLEDLPSNSMASKYVEPLLLSGHKFDIGVYVLILSTRPLVVYTYRNILVRVCSEPTPANLTRRSHKYAYVIDDYRPAWSIPATGQFYTRIPSNSDEGTSNRKALFAAMARLGIDPVRAWERTRSAVQTALLSTLPAMRRAGAAVMGDARVLRAAQQAVRRAQSRSVLHRTRANRTATWPRHSPASHLHGQAHQGPPAADRSSIGENEWESSEWMQWSGHPKSNVLHSGARGAGIPAEISSFSRVNIEAAGLQFAHQTNVSRPDSMMLVDRIISMAQTGRADVDRLAPSSTFELLRFDFVYDRSGTPWLLEVNMSPNLHPHKTNGQFSGSDGAMKRGASRAALAMASSAHWISPDAIAMLEAWNQPSASGPGLAIDVVAAYGQRMSKLGLSRENIDLCPMSAARLLQLLSIHRRRGDMELLWPPESGPQALSAAHAAFGLGRWGWECSPASFHEPFPCSVEQAGSSFPLDPDNEMTAKLEGPVARGRSLDPDSQWNGQEMAWERRAGRAFAAVIEGEHRISQAAALRRLSSDIITPADSAELLVRASALIAEGIGFEGAGIDIESATPDASSGLQRACYMAGGVPGHNGGCLGCQHAILGSYIARWYSLLVHDRPLLLSASGEHSEVGMQAASVLRSSAVHSSGVWDVPEWRGWKASLRLIQAQRVAAGGVADPLLELRAGIGAGQSLRNKLRQGLQSVERSAVLRDSVDRSNPSVASAERYSVGSSNLQLLRSGDKSQTANWGISQYAAKWPTPNNSPLCEDGDLSKAVAGGWRSEGRQEGCETDSHCGDYGNQGVCVMTNATIYEKGWSGRSCLCTSAWHGMQCEFSRQAPAVVPPELRADGSEEAGAARLPGWSGAAFDWFGVSQGERQVVPVLVVVLSCLMCVVLSLAQAVGAIRVPGVAGRALAFAGNASGACIDVMLCGDQTQSRACGAIFSRFCGTARKRDE